MSPSYPVLWQRGDGTGWLNWYSVGLGIQRPEVPTPSGEEVKLGSFSESKMLCRLRCRCAQPPACIRTRKNNHVRTLKIPLSMSEFGGLRKHVKTQHALAGLTPVPALVAQLGQNVDGDIFRRVYASDTVCLSWMKKKKKKKKKQKRWLCVVDGAVSLQ